MPMEVEQVAQACAREFGITFAVMRGKRRDRRAMEARYMAAHICLIDVHRYRLWKVKQKQGEHSGYWVASRAIHRHIEDELAELIDKDYTSIRWFYDRACESLEGDEEFRNKRAAIMAELAQQNEAENESGIEVETEAAE